MKMHLGLVCACALPLMLSTSGCTVVETVAFVLENEQIQKSLESVAEHTLSYVLGKIFPAAEARSSSDGAKCAADTPPQIWVLAAQGVASSATERALESVSRTPGGDPRRLQITLQCNQGESKEDCEQRARRILTYRLGEITEGLKQTSMANVELERGTAFASTWPACRDQVEQDMNASDLSKVAQAVDACMTDKGFGAEIAAIKHLFPAVG
jgi:hypothetical protein